MQIYLAKPGGPKEGPYSLERINADLAARRYRDDAFWAWHIGLAAWVPLYSVGGVAGAADTTFFFAKPVPKGMRAPASPPEPPAADTTIFLAKRCGAELAWQRPQSSDHVEVAHSAAAPVAELLCVQPRPPANPQPIEFSPTPVAKPCPEPAQAATITPISPAPGTATAMFERQESQTPAAPSAAQVVAAAETRPMLKECPPLADTPPASCKVTAMVESKGQEPQTPVRPSAPQSIAFPQATLAPEQPRTAPKKTVSAGKRSSSPRKSPDGKPKAQVGPQVAKSAKPSPIPNHRALSTPVLPSAPPSIASAQDALAPEQPRTAPKTVAPAQKNSSSPRKSPNGKPKARVGPQVEKSARLIPIPNRRVLSIRRGALLAPQ